MCDDKELVILSTVYENEGHTEWLTSLITAALPAMDEIRDRVMLTEGGSIQISADLHIITSQETYCRIVLLLKHMSLQRCTQQQHKVIYKWTETERIRMEHWSGLRENLTCFLQVNTHRGGREGWVWYGSQAGRATWPHWSPCWMRAVSMDSLNHSRDRSRISWLCSKLAHVFCFHSGAIFLLEINMNEWTFIEQCIKEQWNPKPMLPPIKVLV